MSTNWQAKAGVVNCEGEGYKWSQTREEVLITVPVAPGTRGKEIICDITKTTIKVGIKGQELIMDGKLFGTVKADDSLWTLERDGSQHTLEIELIKAEGHQLWKSVIMGKDAINQFVEEEINKKMMLERFQGEHAGFDFSGAEFTGQAPEDPKNFMRF